MSKVSLRKHLTEGGRRVDKTVSIGELKLAVEKLCIEKGWNESHTAKDLAIGIATESSELLEHFRFRSDDAVAKMLANSAMKNKVVEELIDVLLLTIRFAQRFDIDLASAAFQKMDKISMRKQHR